MVIASPTYVNSLTLIYHCEYSLVINEDIYVELLELLELYCELLLARFGLLDQKYALNLAVFILCPMFIPLVLGNQMRGSAKVSALSFTLRLARN